MNPEEVTTKSAAINARRDTESFTQMVSAFCRHETPTLPPHDPPADLDDMDCLRLLTTRAEPPTHVVSYANRLLTRPPESLTDSQRLVVWVVGAIRAGEQLLTAVAVRDKLLTLWQKTTAKPEQQTHHLHRLDWELIDGKWTRVTKAEIYGWCPVNTETGEVELDDFNQFDDNLKELLDGWTWQRFTLIPSTTPTETTCTESP